MIRVSIDYLLFNSRRNIDELMHIIHVPERCGLLVGLLFGTRLLFGPNAPGCCV